MKIFDVTALTPPDVEPEDWKQILELIHGSDHQYPTTSEQRLSWLKRLAEDEVWGEAIVITDRREFPFWRLCPPKVIVQDEAGKNLGKPQRTTDQDDWAFGVVISSTKKSDVAKARKAGGPAVGWAEMLKTDYIGAESNGQDLYETDGTYELVTPARFSEVKRKILQEIRLGKWWCWDSETDETLEDDQESPNPWSARLVDITVSTQAGHAYRFPVSHGRGEANFPTGMILWTLRKFYSETARAGGKVVLHNCKYDYGMASNPIQNMPVSVVYDEWLPVTFDTLLAARVACRPRAGLKPLAESDLGLRTLDYKKLTAGKPFSEVPTEAANIYAGQDADWPLRLLPGLQTDLDELGVRHVYEREMGNVEYFMRCERNGFPVDRPALEEHHDESIVNRAFARDRLIQCFIREGVALPILKDGPIASWHEFNPGSPQQLAQVFFSDRPQGLGLPILTRSNITGAPSIGAKALNKLISEGISHPAMALYKVWSKYEQRVTAFTTPIQKMIHPDGKLHPSFGQAAADTGRSTMHDPNGQQMYPELRKLIRREGYRFGGIDYSQIELRVLACEFNEPKMLETYNLPRFLPDGTENPEADIHNRTKVGVGLPTRTKAKNFNFGMAFGAGADTLSVTAALPKPQAQAFLDAMHQLYSEYTRNLKLRVKQAQEEGLVRNWFGRVRLLPRPVTKQQHGQFARLVSNTPVQGGAYDIAAWAIEEALPLIRIADDTMGIHPFNFVHDEFDFYCEPWVSEARWRGFLHDISRIMTRCNPWPDLLPIYTDIEIGDDWGSLKAPPADEIIAAAALEAA